MKKLPPIGLLFLFVVFGYMAPAADAWPCIDPPEDLVSWWTGDGTAQDEVGANPGTLMGGAGFAPGMVIPGFSFDGVDDYVNIGDRNTLDFGTAQDFSIDAWIMTLGSPDVQGILDKREAATSQGYLVSVLTDGSVLLSVGNNVARVSVASASKVNDGQFHHIAVVFDRDADAKIYIDGQFDAAADMTVVGDVSNPGTFTVGRGNINNPPSLHKAFHGTIDELRVFARALSAVEVQDAFDSGSDGACFGAPLPAVPWGGEVEVVTRLRGRPGEIAINSDGDVFVGNLDYPGNDAAEVPIFRIEAGSSVPEYCGAPIPDPDVVLLDRNGYQSAPGNVIVGSLGRLSAVEQDCSGVTILVQDDSNLRNPQDMEMDSQGRIVYFDHGNLLVGAYDGSNFQVLVSGVSTTTTIAVDESNLYLTPEASESSIVELYDLDGNLVDADFASGRARKVVRVGTRKGLLLERSNTLIFLDLSSLEETTLLTNLFDSIGYDVDDDGYLVLTQAYARRLLRVVPPLLDLIDTAGAVAGSVEARCPEAGTPLFGATIDVFDSEGTLVAWTLTDESGHYEIADLPAGEYTFTLVTPLGYVPTEQDVPVTVGGGQTTDVDFDLVCSEAAGAPRGTGFWKHQVAVATGGKGRAQIDGETLCGYLDLIADHFNDNEINSVAVYGPPASGDCAAKLDEAAALINLKGNVGMLARAKQQLLSVLFNVAAGNIALFAEAGADGATVSQAITWCDLLIDDPAGDWEVAKETAEAINHGDLVAAGVIPLDMVNIAYRIGLPGGKGAQLEQNRPNPFNPQTKIRFSLPEAALVSLRIYDVSGRLVRSLINGEQVGAGPQEVVWAGLDSAGQPVAGGVYFYRLETPTFSEAKRMTLLK